MFIILCYSPTFPGHDSANSSTPGQAHHRGDPQPALAFYSRIFLAPRKSGNWRPVIDLSALNKFLHSPHFWMEMATSIMCSLQQGHWATSVDFKDAFFPHSDHSCSPTLPQLPVWLLLLPVPGPPIWPGHVTLRLHLSGQSSTCLRQRPGPLPASLPGQLEHLSPHSPCLHGLDLLAPQPIPAAQPSRQPSQVQPSAIQTLRVCGHQLRPFQWHCQTGPQLSTEPPALPPVLRHDQGPSSHQMAAASRPHDLPGETHKTGPSPHASPPVCSAQQLGSVIRSPLHSSAHATGHYAQPYSGGCPPTTCFGGSCCIRPSSTPALHRHFHQRVGGSSDTSPDLPACGSPRRGPYTSTTWSYLQFTLCSSIFCPWSSARS